MISLDRERIATWAKHTPIVNSVWAYRSENRPDQWADDKTELYIELENSLIREDATTFWLFDGSDLVLGLFNATSLDFVLRPLFATSQELQDAVKTTGDLLYARKP